MAHISAHRRPGRSPATAHTVSGGESVEERPWARQDSRNVTGRCCTISGAGRVGVWLRAGSRLGLVCRGTVYLLVGYLAFRLALAAHGRTGAPASSAGAVQAAVAPAWGRVPLVLARRWTRRVRAHPAARGRVPAFPRGQRDRQVASACGVVVGMFAVLGLLPEHRPASGGDSCEADGAVGAATGHGRDRGLAANGMGPAAAGPGRDPFRGGRRGGGSPVGPARLPGAVHRRAHVPGAGHAHAGRLARLAASRAPSCSCWSVSSWSRPRCCPARSRRRGWTRSSVRWPAPHTARGCWPCSRPACSATAFTA